MVKINQEYRQIVKVRLELFLIYGGKNYGKEES